MIKKTEVYFSEFQIRIITKVEHGEPLRIGHPLCVKGLLVQHVSQEVKER